MARRTKRRPRAKTPLRRTRVQSVVGIADGQSTATAVSKSTRKRGQYEKRERKLIRALADKKWPDGLWEHLSTPKIMKALEPEFKNRDLPFPERDTFLRALDRRRG